MSLKIELRPKEKIIIGSTVITNGDNRAQFFIDGSAPLLREKDIFTAKTADTPAKRIYLAVQLIYLNEDLETHREVYFDLVDEFLEAAPSARAIIDDVNNQILTGSVYKALKNAKKLIEYEEELISHAQSSSGLSTRKPNDRQPT